MNNRKNEISKELLSQVNKELKGDFSVEDIDLGSLWSYPNLKVTLRNLRFDAQGRPDTISPNRSILEVERAVFKADLSKVLSNQILIEDLFIQGGLLRIEKDSLGEMVISQGFTPVEDNGQLEDKDEPGEDSGLFIKIPNILIEDMKVEIIDGQKDLLIPFESHEITGNFQLENDLITGRASIQTLPMNLSFIDQLYINKIPLS